MSNKELELVLKLEMDCAVFKSGVFSNKTWIKNNPFLSAQPDYVWKFRKT